MGNGCWRDYPSHQREFDGWLKANAALASILAVGILAMALARLYSAGPADRAAELSSVHRVEVSGTAATSIPPPP